MKKMVILVFLAAISSSFGAKIENRISYVLMDDFINSKVKFDLSMDSDYKAIKSNCKSNIVIKKLSKSILNFTFGKAVTETCKMELQYSGSRYHIILFDLNFIKGLPQQKGVISTEQFFNGIIDLRHFKGNQNYKSMPFRSYMFHGFEILENLSEIEFKSSKLPIEFRFIDNPFMDIREELGRPNFDRFLKSKPPMTARRNSFFGILMLDDPIKPPAQKIKNVYISKQLLFKSKGKKYVFFIKYKTNKI
jgi:hypothetical protein